MGVSPTGPGTTKGRGWIPQAQENRKSTRTGTTFPNSMAWVSPISTRDMCKGSLAQEITCRKRVIQKLCWTEIHVWT